MRETAKRVRKMIGGGVKLVDKVFFGTTLGRSVLLAILLPLAPVSWQAAVPVAAEAINQFADAATPGA